jgi:hypothetical protein
MMGSVNYEMLMDIASSTSQTVNYAASMIPDRKGVDTILLFMICENGNASQTKTVHPEKP